MILLGKVTSRIPWFSLIGIGLVALLTVPAWTQAPPSPNATKKSASDEFQSAREDFKEAVNDFDPRSEGKQPAARDPAGFEGKRAADDVVVEGNQPFLDDLAGASSQAELDQLEARLEQVLAEVRQLVERLRWLDDDIGAAMIIGHNPGLEQLANGLSASPKTADEEKLHRRMREKFSTCALAVVELPVASWREVKMGVGTLKDFMRPKDL